MIKSSALVDHLEFKRAKAFDPGALIFIPEGANCSPTPAIRCDKLNDDDPARQFALTLASRSDGKLPAGLFIEVGTFRDDVMLGTNACVQFYIDVLSHQEPYCGGRDDGPYAELGIVGRKKYLTGLFKYDDFLNKSVVLVDLATWMIETIPHNVSPTWFSDWEMRAALNPAEPLVLRRQK